MRGDLLQREPCRYLRRMSRERSVSPAFVPPFCPNERCRFHDVSQRAEWKFQRRGSRTVQRSAEIVCILRCTACGRWFCSAAFHNDYWRKIAALLPKVYHGIPEGLALRQVGRRLPAKINAVRLTERRLGKQSLPLHHQQVQALRGRLTEPLLLDGQRSFTGSQYEPIEVHDLVTAETGFWLECRAFGIRRSGSMTARQKRVCKQRERRRGRLLTR